MTKYFCNDIINKKDIKGNDEEGAEYRVPKREMAVGASHGTDFDAVASEPGGRKSTKRDE